MTLRRRAGTLTAAGSWGVATATVLSFCGRYYYPLDALSHFRAHLVAAAFMLLVGTVLLLHWRMALMSAGLMAANLLGLAPAATLPVSDTVPDEVAITLVTFNIWGRNPDLDLATKVLAGSGADVILLQEVHPHAAELLGALQAAYPFQLTCRSMPECDGAILSRLEWSRSGAVGPDADHSPMVWATFERDGRSFTIAGTHLDRPPASRHLRQVDSISGGLAPLARPLILAGDFNATPWSYAMTRLIGATGLVPLSGLRATWPAHLGVPQFPIDHVLVSDGWRNLGTERGPYAGSDHRPIIARLALEGGR